MHSLRRGFTLIELMVVVALVSIMLVIAVPSFASFISNYRVTGAMNDFLQGIALTRNEAMKQGRRMSMVPLVAGDWKSGWVIFRDVAGGGPCAATPNAVLDAAEKASVVFNHDPLADSIVVTSSTGAGVPFTDPGARTYISFDGTGYPRQYCGGFIAGGIVMTDRTGASVGASGNVRTLCLGMYGRARIVKDAPGCGSG